MVEPTAGPFPAAAAAALAPVAGKVEQVRDEAAAGGLRIDLDDAEVLLLQIHRLRLRAADLVEDSAVLDTPLGFGDNWVGRMVAERLRAVAVDENGGVTPVLRTFHDLLDSVEAIIRLAAGRYQATDEQAVCELRRAAGRLGIRTGDQP